MRLARWRRERRLPPFAPEKTSRQGRPPARAGRRRIGPPAGPADPRHFRSTPSLAHPLNGRPCHPFRSGRRTGGPRSSRRPRTSGQALCGRRLRTRRRRRFGHAGLALMGAAFTHARICARERARADKFGHTITRTRTHIGSEGRLERRKPGGRPRLFRSRPHESPAPHPVLLCTPRFGPAPRPVHRTCIPIVVRSMVGQAQQSGSIAPTRRFETACFERAPSHSPK